MQHRLPFAPAVAVALVALASPPAHAREPVELAQAEVPPPAPVAPSPPGKKVEEYVVHGGESEAVADVAAGDSVTGFDAADLEALGAQTIEDIAKFTPNLEIVTTGSTTPTFFIRGVGLNDFNVNSTSAVAVYQDDVQKNSPAIQLGTLFDMEAVNVLRGPQGTGAARNASAGAIKLYSKRPSGRYSSHLRTSYGNFDSIEVTGAVEAPVYEDLLAARLAFHVADREGYGRNRCAGAPANPPVRPPGSGQNTDPRWSFCSERVPAGSASAVPTGLPERVNNRGNWAARGSLLFQPTLDMTWLAIAHGSRRDEQSRLGQAIGTNGDQILPDGTRIEGLLGSIDNGRYQAPEVVQMRSQAFNAELAKCSPGCTRQERIAAQARANISVAETLAKQLDTAPFDGDYNRVGPTENDTWGVSLKGEIVLPGDIELKTVSGYDSYERLVDIDLDFTPNALFEIRTQDEGWQFAQDLSLAGVLGPQSPFRWEVGGLYLMEELDVLINNDFGQNQVFGVSERQYTQSLWSLAGYGSFEWDLGTRFTLDGGVRYNWERKSLDYRLQRNEVDFVDKPTNVWQAPTGTIRLTYRFREDTHAYWKYTRGWKGGHYNATSSDVQRITIADPETIDAFEAGMRGSWWNGRIGLDAQLFYYDYKNYQIFTAQQQLGGQPEFVILNAKGAEVYGSEMELSLRPLPGMFVQGRFSWLESQFLDFVQIQTSTQQRGGQVEIVQRELQNSGNRLLNSPRFKVSITAEQLIPLGRFGALTARWDGAWTHTTYYDPTEGAGIPNQNNVTFLPKNTIGQGPFWVHNLRVGYRPPRGRLEVAGWVRNLTDEVYKTFAFDGTTFNQTTIYFVGEPRTYGLTLTVDF